MLVMQGLKCGWRGITPTTTRFMLGLGSEAPAQSELLKPLQHDQKSELASNSEKVGSENNLLGRGADGSTLQKLRGDMRKGLMLGFIEVQGSECGVPRARMLPALDCWNQGCE